LRKVKRTIEVTNSANGSNYKIDTEKCSGCTICARKCPVEAIVGEKKKAHYIIDEKCVRCGACFEVCRFEAVKVS